MKLGKPLTWEEICELYGDDYKNKDMKTIFDFVKSKPEIHFNEYELTLHLIIGE